MGTPTLLVGGTQLQDTLVAHYATPAGSVTIITAACFNNPASRGCDVWVHIVSPGATADESNQVVTRLRVPSSAGTVLVPALVGQVLPAGYTIQMRSDTAGAITPLISGDVREVS